MVETATSKLTNMTAFLMDITQSRGMTGHNIVSWVTAVENKLADISILTIQEMVASIPTINPQLVQVGHAAMFTQTLYVMSQKGVERLHLDESSSTAVHDRDEMLAFLHAVAGSRGITRTAIDSWGQKVQSKLHRIGISTV